MAVSGNSTMGRERSCVPATRSRDSNTRHCLQGRVVNQGSWGGCPGGFTTEEYTRDVLVDESVDDEEADEHARRYALNGKHGGTGRFPVWAVNRVRENKFTGCGT